MASSKRPQKALSGPTAVSDTPETKVLGSMIPREILDDVPPPGMDLFELEVSDGNVLIVMSIPARLAQAIECCTSAERDVLKGVLAGYSDAEIARQRGRAPRTVVNQVRSLMRRLGVSTRRELASQLTMSRPPRD